MKYKENNQLQFIDAVPSTSYTSGKYFEFEIVGKNTSTNKDIEYDVVIVHGDNHPTRSERIADRFLKFRLVEITETNNVKTEVEPDLIEAKSYSSIDNTRIYVSTIPRKTTNDIRKIYRAALLHLTYHKGVRNLSHS